jgi:hypothetical protein
MKSSGSSAWPASIIARRLTSHSSAALGRNPADIEIGLKHLQDGLDLHHGRADFDGSALILKQLPGQFCVKQPQRVDGLLGCYFGPGHSCHPFAGDAQPRRNSACASSFVDWRAIQGRGL